MHVCLELVTTLDGELPSVYQDRPHPVIRVEGSAAQRNAASCAQSRIVGMARHSNSVVQVQGKLRT